MSENLTSETAGGDSESAPAAAPPPKRGPGHRGQDIRDTMAEMAAKAHEISLEAGSKMSSAMRDVIGAAAGISAFAIESARDLVNYMVRRGQMSQEEATKLLRDVEDAHSKRPKDVKKSGSSPIRDITPKPAPKPAAKPKVESAPKAEKPKAPAKAAAKGAAPAKPAAKKTATKKK